MLSEEAKAIRNAYNREWRKKNSDKMREYRERQWEKKARLLREAQENEDDKTSVGV